MRVFSLWLLAALTGSLGVSASAQEADSITEVNSIKFITIDVAPWASTDPSTGEMIGAFPEIIAAITNLTGLEASISLTPFARVDRELESGDHDCTILIPRPDELVVFGELVSYHAIGVIGRKGLSLKHYEDMTDKRISVLRGASIHPRFDEDSDLNKQFDTDYAIALRKLDRERIDIIAGAIPTIQFIAKEEGVAHKLGEILQLGEVPLTFQCSKKSHHLDKMALINEAIRTIKTDGTLEDIRQRHYF